MKNKKPPIGIIPRHLWLEQRRRNLAEAINRYLLAQMEIPTKWVEEYNELTIIINKP